MAETDREERLAAVVGELQDALNEGRRPRAEEWSARHPEFRPEIEAFLRREGLLESALAPAGLAGARSPSGAPEGLELEGIAIRRRLPDSSWGPVWEVETEDGGLVELASLRPDLDERLLARIDEAVARFSALALPGVALPRDLLYLGEVPVVVRDRAEGITLAAIVEGLARGGGRVAFGRAAAALDDADAPPPSAPQRRAVAARLAGRAGHRLAVLEAFSRWALLLDAAHREGVVHGALGPDDLVLDARGAPSIRGVGLGPGALPRRAVELPARCRRWLAPELARPRLGPTTIFADVYGLGACLAATLALESPFAGVGDEQILDRLGFDDPFDPARIPGVEEELRALLRRCLARDPAERPTGLREVADALDRRRRRLRGRRRLLLVALATVLAGVLLGAILAFG